MDVDYSHVDRAKDEQAPRSRRGAPYLGIYVFVSLVAVLSLAAALYKQKQNFAVATSRLTGRYELELARANRESSQLRERLGEQQQLVTAQAEKLQRLREELDRTLLMQRAREAIARAAANGDYVDPEAERRAAKQREKRRKALHCAKDDLLCDL